MPKIQETSRNLIYISIPKDHAELLGWKKGEMLIAESNKSKDTLTFKRIKKG